MSRTSEEMTTPFVRDAAMNAPMFNAFRAAKQVKMPRWAIPLLTAAAIFHVVLFVTMWIKSIWEVEQLEKSKSLSDIAIAPPPPPPPAPPPGSVKPQVQPQLVQKKRVVKDLVQVTKVDPVKVAPETPAITDVECDPTVETCGDDPKGIPNGIPGGPPPPPEALPPPPPPPAPVMVAPPMLEGSRIRGDKNIAPDDTTKTEMARAGKDRITGSFKICLSTSGDVVGVSMMKSTTYGAYDAKIQREMRSWGYRPYMIGGKAVPVCTAITFIYAQTR